MADRPVGAHNVYNFQTNKNRACTPRLSPVQYSTRSCVVYAVRPYGPAKFLNLVHGAVLHTRVDHAGKVNVTFIRIRTGVFYATGSPNHGFRMMKDVLKS